MKMMHISDLHLGKRVNGFSMIEDQRYIIRELLRIADEEKAEVILIAGDIDDRNHPSGEAVALYDELLTELSKREGLSFIISGNHDMAQNIALGSRVMDVRGLVLSPVYDGNARMTVLRDEWGEIAFHLLPFVRPAHVRAAFPDAEIHSYSDALRQAVEAMDVDGSRRNVIITHQFVAGGIRSDSEDLSVGGTDGVEVSIFDPFDYVALGHLHRAQSVGRETIRYSGSPLKYSVSEAGDVKSVTVVDMGEKGQVSVKEVPLVPARDLRRLRGSYAELTLRANYENTAVDDYLYITLTDEEEIPEVLGRLRTIYPNIMKLDYANRRYSADQLTEPVSGAERTDPADLFGELFQQQNNREMNHAERTYVENLVQKIWGEQA